MVLDLGGAVAVVTGAASGIGAELAVLLAERGAGLALVDRNAAGLETVRERLDPAARVSVHIVDLADRLALEAVAEEVEAAHGRVTLLVNNAGVAIAGPFVDYGPADFETLMDVNFWAGVRLTRAFLPLLKAEAASQIVYVSSIFGIVGFAGNVAYCASKFAIRGFAEALRQELRHTPVGVTVVHPGGVNTNIARDARAAAATDPDEARQSMARFQSRLRMPPERAARKILAGIEARRRRVVIGADAYAIDALQRLAPAFSGDVLAREALRFTPGLARTAP
jgi:short-subunit dehydrogenase